MLGLKFAHDLLLIFRRAAVDHEDFQIAFFVVGGLSALAGAIYIRLPADAGSNVSGHRAAAIGKE